MTCNCMGKAKDCTCRGRCRCECTCNQDKLTYEFDDFDASIFDKVEHDEDSKENE